MKNENNFFTQNMQRYGENFLDYINARDVQFASINIFRSIAKGRIDLRKYGKYFLDNQFLESCIQGAQSKYLLFSTSFNGVNFMVQQQNIYDPYVLSVLEYNRKCTEAYTLVLNALNAVKVTGDLNNLYILENTLRPYRNNI